MRKAVFLITGGFVLSVMVLSGLWGAARAVENADAQVYLPLVLKNHGAAPTGTLTICMGQEPETLYPYGSFSVGRDSVLEAIYDGPIDNRSYDYQATILEKVPSLADTDAITRTVTVNEGDQVVDANNNVIALSVGASIYVAGSNTPITYDGGPVDMVQMVVTFTLRSGLVWSDGTALTAQDSVYSFNLDKDPDTPTSKDKVDRTDTYVAVDAQSARWIGLPGFRDNTYYTNFWVPYPEHIWGTYTAAELLTATVSTETPMGWGPYVIQEWVKGDHITLQYNPLYYRRSEGLPNFEQVVYRFVGEDSNNNLSLLLSGECDVVDQTAHMDDIWDTLVALDKTGQLQLLTATSPVWEHADFGIQHRDYDDGYDPSTDRYDYFSDVRVRQAIAYCMDRQRAVDEIYDGRNVVLDSYIPPEHPLYNSNVAHYNYDPTTGKSLLAQAGWTDTDGDGIVDKDGVPLEFYLGTTTATSRQQVTQIWAESLAQCGIHAILEYYPSSEWFADGPEGPLFGRKFDMGEFAWLTDEEPPCDLFTSDAVPGPDLETWTSILTGQSGLTFPYGWGGWNETGYVNANYDAACHAAMNSLPGLSEYETQHKEAQRIFAEDLPVIPLFQRIKMVVARPDINGVLIDPTARSEFWNLEAIERVP